MPFLEKDKYLVAEDSSFNSLYNDIKEKLGLKESDRLYFFA
jgi:hypothetical protein